MNTTAIQIFTSPLGFSIRTVERAGDPWFVAADVCQALEVRNPRQAISRLDEEEKGVISNDTLGGAQRTNVVSESGLYTLIMGSRKQEARVFQRWVTRDVLPSIRRTGRYEAPGPAREGSYLEGFKAGILFAGQLPQREEKADLLRPQPRTNRSQPIPTYHRKGDGLPVKIAPWVHPKIAAAQGDILAMPTPVGMNEIFAMLREEHGVQRNRGNEMGVSKILKDAGLLRRKISQGKGQVWVYVRE